MRTFQLTVGLLLLAFVSAADPSTSPAPDSPVTPTANPKPESTTAPTAKPASTTTTAPPTTVKPDPKPTSAPTTTAKPDPKPTPAPEPAPSNVTNPVVKFELKDATTGDYCAVGQFSGEVQIVPTGQPPIHLQLDNSTALNEKVSKCDNQTITLTFILQDKTADTLSMKLNRVNQTYQLDVMSLSILDDKENSTAPEAYNGIYEQTLFSVSADRSFVCLAQQALAFTPSKLNGTITFQLHDLRMDAFRASNTTDLRTASECELDNTPRDFVPMAVGISLIALVVIVLIAYLIGRKRSRRLAYESV